MNHPQPMSESEHWWNHLSYQQREFICSRITVSDHLGVPIFKVAYAMKDYFRNREGWPEFSSSDMHSKDFGTLL